MEKQLRKNPRRLWGSEEQMLVRCPDVLGNPFSETVKMHSKHSLQKIFLKMLAKE